MMKRCNVCERDGTMERDVRGERDVIGKCLGKDKNQID